MFFKLNCRYHFYMSYEKDINPQFKSRTKDELLVKL